MTNGLISPEFARKCGYVYAILWCGRQQVVDRIVMTRGLGGAADVQREATRLKIPCHFTDGQMTIEAGDLWIDATPAAGGVVSNYMAAKKNEVRLVVERLKNATAQRRAS